jgi:phage shock protein E
LWSIAGIWQKFKSIKWHWVNFESFYSFYKTRQLFLKSKSHIMINAIKNLFGFGPQTDYVQLMNKGAILLDVRSKGEYAGGHINGSINIPLDQLADNHAKLKGKNKPVITCCASGIRSASAKNILESNGFTEVYNGGGWSSLQNKIK